MKKERYFVNPTYAELWAKTIRRYTNRIGGKLF